MDTLKRDARRDEMFGYCWYAAIWVFAVVVLQNLEEPFTGRHAWFWEWILEWRNVLTWLCSAAAAVSALCFLGGLYGELGDGILKRAMKAAAYISVALIVVSILIVNWEDINGWAIVAGAIGLYVLDTLSMLRRWVLRQRRGSPAVARRT